MTWPDGATTHNVYAVLAGDCVGTQAMQSPDDPGVPLVITLGRNSPDAPWEVSTYETWVDGP